jgi:hypothetical protein
MAELFEQVASRQLLLKCAQNSSLDFISSNRKMIRTSPFVAGPRPCAEPAGRWGLREARAVANHRSAQDGRYARYADAADARAPRRGAQREARAGLELGSPDACGRRHASVDRERPADVPGGSPRRWQDTLGRRWHRCWPCPSDGRADEIALGWHVAKRGGREIVWHNGGTGGPIAHRLRP